MRKIACIIALLVCSFKLYAQQDEFKIMIDSAVKITYSQLSGIAKNPASKYYFENLYLLNEQDQPLNYLPTVNKLGFKFISISNDRNRKKLAKGIYAWKVLTTLNKNEFVITIIDFYITYKDHNYNFANGGGSKTVFDYDCDENKWKLISSKYQGN